MLDAKQTALVTLAKKRGNDADLLLLDMIHTLQAKVDALEMRVHSDPALPTVEKIATKLALEFARIEKGEPGDTPTDEYLVSLIEPLIPEVKDGEDYVLTAQDKKEIAASIKVPVVEKVTIEKTTVEKPIVTNEIREVAVTDTGDQIIEKINTADSLISTDAIEGLDKIVKDLKSSKKNISIPGWGAHPLVIQNSSGVVIEKVARVLKFGNGTVTRSASGVVTITPAGSGAFVGSQEKSTTSPNNSQQTFAFTHTPTLIYWNGQMQTLTDDYTVSSNNITFTGTNTPQTGDKIVNVYA